MLDLSVTHRFLQFKFEILLLSCSFCILEGSMRLDWLEDIVAVAETGEYSDLRQRAGLVVVSVAFASIRFVRKNVSCLTPRMERGCSR